MSIKKTKEYTLNVIALRDISRKYMKSICIFTAIAFVLISFSQTNAQTGALRGGASVLSGSTSGSVTLNVPSSIAANYSMTFPSSQSSGTQYLYDSLGILKWGTPTGGSGGVNFNNSTLQQTAQNSTYLFDVEYAPGATGPLPGAILVSEIHDVNNSPSIASGVDLQVSNTSVAASGVTLTGIVVNVANSGSGTQTGIKVDATGNTTDKNYAMFLTGGNVGIGTATPAEALEVSGNIRISGTNGLKITEGTNAAMGTATLVAGTKVVNTTKVTANSRIFLTTNTPGGAIGALYVSARTAGTSFTIKSSSATETSTVAWVIIEP